MRHILIIFAMLLTSACTRRALGDSECSQEGNDKSADINVSVDWSLSGLDADQKSRNDENYIHRVSFRFFPKDGSAPFDRYLEDNVKQGVINIPIGEYSVVVFNEAIDDTYWKEAIEFENINNYQLFSAKIVDQDKDLYSFYTPSEDEALSVEALQLASYSVDSFNITEEMCRTRSKSWSKSDMEMISQLDPATPRRLTCPTTIEVDTENLASANRVYASLSGLAQRVFMASGDTDTATTTHVGELTQRTWHDSTEQQHGVISERRLTFYVPAGESSHTLTLDVILVDGARYTPDEEMTYDVTNQIVGAATRYADNDLGAKVSLSLPKVSGSIEVDGWGDDNEITIL